MIFEERESERGKIDPKLINCTHGLEAIQLQHAALADLRHRKINFKHLNVWQDALPVFSPMTRV